MSNPEAPFIVCPPGRKHLFRDMRGKNRSQSAGPPWRYWKSCRNCDAVLEVVVTETKQPNGDIIPNARGFIFSPLRIDPVCMFIREVRNATKKA